MRLDDIAPKDERDLSASITFMLSAESKNAIMAIARAKRRTPSEIVREIVDKFLMNNKEELKHL